MPFESSMLAAIPPTLFVFKGNQTSYESQSIPGEIQAIFKTVASIKSDILRAREKRVVLAKTCELEDLIEWDESVSETEAALLNLERLVETARIDDRHNNGKMKFKTKLLWLVRDHRTLSATTDRLSLAHQRMLSVMLMTRVERDQERGEQENGPPPCLADRGTIKKVADALGRGDDIRVAPDNSRQILRDGGSLSRSVSLVQTTAESSVSARERGFEDMINIHQSARAQSQFRSSAVPQTINEPELYHVPLLPSQSRMSSLACPERKPLIHSPLPNLTRNRAIPRAPADSRPHTMVSFPLPPRSRSSNSSDTISRSPSPFQDEMEAKSQGPAELEAIPVAPVRRPALTSPLDDDRMHQDFAKQISFKQRHQHHFPATFANIAPHDRLRARPPYPVTNPTTPEPMYVNPYMAHLRTTDRTQQHIRSMNIQIPSASGVDSLRSFSKDIPPSMCPGHAKVVARSHVDIYSSQGMPPMRDETTQSNKAIADAHRTFTAPVHERLVHEKSQSPSRDISEEVRYSVNSQSSMVEAARSYSPVIPASTFSELDLAVKYTPHFFVGHKRPVNIRWQPELKAHQNDSASMHSMVESIQGKSSQIAIDVTENSHDVAEYAEIDDDVGQEFVYVPYSQAHNI